MLFLVFVCLCECGVLYLLPVYIKVLSFFLDVLA